MYSSTPARKLGKTAEGQPQYSEYHLAVWGERESALARNLGVGDYITFTLEREKIEFRESNGKVYPFLSGNVRPGELCAVYTNKPSAGLFAYEQEAQTKREAAKAQRAATPAPAAVPAAPVAPATYAAPAPAAAKVGNGLIQPVPQAQPAPQAYAPAATAGYAPVPTAAPAPAPAPAAPAAYAAPAPTAAVPTAPTPPTLMGGIEVPF